MHHLTLNKSEKRLARELIEKGLQAEFRTILSEAREILSNWDDQNPDHKETYHELYQHMKRSDKYIARRYDYMTGSKYLPTVAHLLGDKLITVEEVSGFTDQIRNAIFFMAGVEEDNE